ncbi:branched-chain amino acid transport system II carrier protein [Aureitalea sp. L0-47]|uniref:branched-chain amino acid transport system II carrier protein n=1 Tax=Aureitalea sp. L0-47 TaxID=2816962 RepID=UPI002237D377|nr:branched-chain amino acid transport system II carrier protein [Aureitalea sp. L0-47]MCW5518330.1 branched-chain amino acid transport system II carrier protein [Aureitalea sp. L0-47]
MSQRKQIVITAFALFSLFFGAGNLVLPPFLGYNAGSAWFWVATGFAISAVIIPIMAIYGHSKLQGSMLDFGKKVSPWFALIYSVVVYAISISLPSPRTASVAYEMAVEPYFDMSALSLSIVYFILVLIFVLNRNRILSIIGKYLTPLIIIILLLVILFGLFTEIAPLRDSVFPNSFTEGFLEGYQTFDAIGGVVVGGVIVISIGLQGNYNYAEKRRIIARSGLLAGIGLFVIYAGLIALGAWQSGTEEVSNRTELLNLLSTKTLGNTGTAFLAVLVALACFTTAVGVVAGTADFVKGLFKESKLAYVVTAVVGCLVGVLVGQNTVGYIIDIAIPALMFIYPITIVLIALSVLPNSLTTRLVYRTTVITTIVFSTPDFLTTLNSELISSEWVQSIGKFIPFSEVHMGWILPSVIAFGLANLFGSLFKTTSEMS